MSDHPSEHDPAVGGDAAAVGVPTDVDRTEPEPANDTEARYGIDESPA